MARVNFLGPFHTLFWLSAWMTCRGPTVCWCFLSRPGDSDVLQTTEPGYNPEALGRGLRVVESPCCVRPLLSGDVTPGRK